LCELLPVRDYLDNVMVRTTAPCPGYELKGLITYFASDEERARQVDDRGAVAVRAGAEYEGPVRYEVVEEPGNLAGAVRRGIGPKRDERLFLTIFGRSMENKGDRQGLHQDSPQCYFIWDPSLHHRLAASR